MLTRGGYLVHEWGDRSYRFHTASVGKAFSWALIGFAAEDGLLDPDEPINRSWTGEGQLSHPHKYLDRGHHERLTWKHVIGPKEKSEHHGGFAIELGLRWMRRESGVREIIPGVPDWAKWTGDPFYDLYSHAEPGTVALYSSAGFWRLSQALTAVWGRDLKDVLDERLFGKIGIHPDSWDWLPGGYVKDQKVLLPHHTGLLYVPGPSLRDRRQRGAQRPRVGRHERLRPREVRPPERHAGHLEG